jgi:glutamine synthetase
VEDRLGHAYSLNAFRCQGLFGESLIAALRAAGVTPDSFLAEYGPRQFEVTVDLARRSGMPREDRSAWETR